MAGEKKKKTGTKAAEPEKKPRRKAGKKAFRYPGRGAPKIYSDPIALAKDCEKYFASISRVEVVTDRKGKPIPNSLEKEVDTVLWLNKPTMGGLARSLGITDRTLRNYEEDAALGPVVEWAKSVCKDWLMDQVTDRTNKNVKGFIFVLENGYGMKEQVAVDHSGEALEEYLARVGGEKTF